MIVVLMGFDFLCLWDFTSADSSTKVFRNSVDFVWTSLSRFRVALGSTMD